MHSRLFSRRGYAAVRWRFAPSARSVPVTFEESRVHFGHVGVMAHSSLNEGDEMKLDPAGSVENVVAGTVVVIQGEQFDVVCMIADVEMEDLFYGGWPGPQGGARDSAPVLVGNRKGEGLWPPVWGCYHSVPTGRGSPPAWVDAHTPLLFQSSGSFHSSSVRRGAIPE